MSILSRVSSVFAFRTLPVTVLVLLLYTAIFAVTIWIHESPSWPPKAGNKQRGLDLDVAWRDLQAIAAAPHPYNSHNNDRVRDYILSRVQARASKHSDILVSDDVISNATYAGGQIIYFEGNNILVRIAGKNDNEAVLFSAHFDSVSTAPGATDDGMGVATLLNLIDYFGKNPPARTLLFNINNGEEDWLNGAHALLEHPWTSLAKSFLNLEGAGSAGRPLFFRTSNTAVTKAARRASHPHGTVLSADAFKARLVRSGTDFQVYEEAGLKGLDLAFYRKRSRYHTKYDSVSYLEGRNSLWSMMETALDTGLALINMKDGQASSDDSNAVYFDIFGLAMVVMGIKTIMIINIVLLGAGPLAVGILIYLLVRDGKFIKAGSGWIRFPVSLVVSMALTIGLAILYSKFNTYIIYSSDYSVFASLICAFFVSLSTSQKLFTRWIPVHATQQRSIVLLESHVIWWLLLLLDTAGYAGPYGLGGLYFLTFFYAGSLAAVFCVLLEISLARKVVDVNSANFTVDEPSSVHEENGASHEQQEDNHSHHETDTDATERTPLITHTNDQVKVTRTLPVVLEDSPWAMILWSIQLILTSVFPAILATQLVLLLLTALSGTLADGNAPITVYLAVALFSILIILPIAPFINKVHRLVTVVLGLVLVATIVYNMLSFPFSPSSPLKVYFQQTMDLDKSPHGASNEVNIVGIPHYTQKHILPTIPSMSNPNCTTDLIKLDLRSCKFAGLPPNVVPHVSKGFKGHDELITFNATRLTDSTGRITVRGLNTRACRLYFSDPITGLSVKGGQAEFQEKYPIPAGGLKEVRLWSRTWDKEFEVVVAWEGKVRAEKISGRVACEWSEMHEGRIPALDEIVNFLPSWAVVTKYADGLVEGYKSFEL